MKACSNPASDDKGDCEKDEPAASQEHLLQEMLQKQLDTSSSSLPRENWSEFLQVATHQPLYSNKVVKGEHSLDQFLAAQSQVCEEPSTARKRRLTDKSDLELATDKVPVNTSGPSHHETHLYGTTGIGKSRKRENPAYPAHLMPSHTHYASAELGTRGSSKGQRKSEANGNSSSASAPTQVAATEVPVLPEQVILRHRLSVAEIRELPRFHDYQPGHPTKVLYVKNLHPRVSSDDLKAIFDRYPAGDDGSKVAVRLMTGRMKGQAFIEFPSIATAQQAMELANGFLVRDKPLVINYGQGKKGTRLDAREQNEC